VRPWVALHALYETNTFGWQTSLAAEAEHVNARTRSKGSKEQRERRGRRTFPASTWRLIGLDRVGAEVRIYTSAAWKVDNKFIHEYPSFEVSDCLGIKQVLPF